MNIISPPERQSALSGHLLALALLVCAWPVPGRSHATPPAQAAPIQAPALPWVQNAGQWHPDAAFRAETFAGAVWIRRDGVLVHEFVGPREATCADTAGGRRDGRFVGCPRRPNWVLTESFPGARPAVLRGVFEDGGRVSHFVAGRTGDPGEATAYRFVDLGEIHPGIRLELKAAGANVEKLFTVAPGHSVRPIRVRIEGAEGARLDRDGALVLKTGHGPVRFTTPVAFQFDARRERREVPVRYVLHAHACGRTCHEYGFALGRHDPLRAVTIDPLLQATYHGGSVFEDSHYAIEIDPVTDSVYVMGATNSPDLPQATGGGQATFGGGSDAYITRFNATLTTRLQTTYFGGSGAEYPRAIARNHSTGDIYLVGSTTSPSLPSTLGSAQSSPGGGSEDGFIARFNPTLTKLENATFFGGAGVDAIESIAIDSASGNVYTAGTTTSPTLPGTTGAAQTHNAGLSDAFVTMHTPDLSFLHRATFLGGSGQERGRALALNATLEIFLVGTSESPSLPATTGAAQPANAGYGDAFITRIHPNLISFTRTTFFGGPGEEDAYAVRLVTLPDATQVLYVGGITQSATLPAATGGAYPVSAGLRDGFLVRIKDSLSTFEQATFVGGTGNDWLYALARHDMTGEIYVAGVTDSTDFRGALGGAQPGNAGGRDAFVVRLDDSLRALRQATYFGGIGDDYAYGVAISPTTGAVYVAGYTHSSDLQGTGGGAQPALAGPSDSFIARFTPELGSARCSLDMDNDRQVHAHKEGLVLVRHLLGFAPAAAVVGSGITLAQWDQKRLELRLCGVLF
ncbi:MAG: hypothetical protein N3F11_04590 [Casimicrobiaceae bacterium]|nr:hypothetical protein [Casimicrobiaceae bacterium]